MQPGEEKPSETRSLLGFLGRLSETTGGSLLGVGLFALSFYLLYTNEGRALHTAASLDEGLSMVVSLEPNDAINPQNHGRLVHISAPLRTEEELNDPNYSVAVTAVKLKRQVEMYQWVEYQETRDYKEDEETKTETTYTYSTEWKSEVINSRNFDKEIGHINPSAMAVESVTVVAPEVWVGNFLLSKGLVEKIDNFERLRLTDLTPEPDSFLTVDEDYFYHTDTPRSPEVGVVRVSFFYAGLSGQENYSAAPAHVVSVVAMQKENGLVPFKTTSGATIEILYLENLSAEEVFQKEHHINNMKTWGLRALGGILMFVSINLMSGITYKLGEMVPLLKELLNARYKLSPLCISCSLSLLTIATRWVFYRPLLFGALAAISVLPLTIIRYHKTSKKDQ